MKTALVTGGNRGLGKAIAAGLVGAGADRSPEQAAQTALRLAALPPDGPSGKFFRDKQEFEW